MPTQPATHSGCCGRAPHPLTAAHPCVSIPARSAAWVITGFEMDYALVPEDSAAALIMPVFNFLRIQCGEPYSCSP